MGVSPALPPPLGGKLLLGSVQQLVGITHVIYKAQGIGRVVSSSLLSPQDEPGPHRGL